MHKTEIIKPNYAMKNPKMLILIKQKKRNKGNSRNWLRNLWRTFQLPYWEEFLHWDPKKLSLLFPLVFLRRKNTKMWAKNEVKKKRNKGVKSVVIILVYHPLLKMNFALVYELLMEILWDWSEWEETWITAWRSRRVFVLKMTCFSFTFR